MTRRYAVLFRPQLPDIPHPPTTLTTQHRVQAPVPSAGRPLTPSYSSAVMITGSAMSIASVRRF